MLRSTIRTALTLLILYFELPVLAAPSATPLRNITLDNAHPLIFYDPPICGTPLTVRDPLSTPLRPPPECEGTWLIRRNENFTEGSVATATVTSARFNDVAPRVTVRFAGSAIGWRTTSYPDGRGALATVAIDDELPVLVNTSALRPGPAPVYNVLAFAAYDLDPTRAHNITIRLLPQTSRTPVMLDIDAFVYAEVPDRTLEISSITTTTSTTSTGSPTTSSARVSRTAFNSALIAVCVSGGLVVVASVCFAVTLYIRHRRRRAGVEVMAVPTEEPEPTTQIPNHQRGQSLVSPSMSDRVLPLAGGYVYG